MGTGIDLYRHANASTIVNALNDLSRSWGQVEHKVYVEMRLALNIQDNTAMPMGTEKIYFESQRHKDFYPTAHKVDRLHEFLRLNQLPGLYEIFGFPSVEPEDIYRVPDWAASLEKMRSLLQAFSKLPASADTEWTALNEDALNESFKELRHKIRFTPPSQNEFRRHLEAFEEMMEWILQQENRHEFFLDWSW